jgi:hypothetical protein
MLRSYSWKGPFQRSSNEETDPTIVPSHFTFKFPLPTGGQSPALPKDGGGYDFHKHKKKTKQKAEGIIPSALIE